MIKEPYGRQWGNHPFQSCSWPTASFLCGLLGVSLVSIYTLSAQTRSVSLFRLGKIYIQRSSFSFNKLAEPVSWDQNFKPICSFNSNHFYTRQTWLKYKKTSGFLLYLYFLFILFSFWSYMFLFLFFFFGVCAIGFLKHVCIVSWELLLKFKNGRFWLLFDGMAP